MPTTGIIRQVADYCWSNNFLDIFRKFFKDHAGDFVDAPPLVQGGEHDLVYYSLFQDYLKIYEDTLTTYVESLDCTIEEFYREVRDAQKETNEEYLQYFIDCLLASADYESFYKVMSKHGKLQQQTKGKTVARADSKADSKRSERKVVSSKKGEDDDDEDDIADSKYDEK
mmetsp:Transcript_23980/g.35194  ORF Transcript_23980/g.35194 Transcript_23980/m.35194 type:complete len:170 (+) Transcript_23980:89-598(+)